MKFLRFLVDTYAERGSPAGAIRVDPRLPFAFEVLRLSAAICGSLARAEMTDRR